MCRWRQNAHPLICEARRLTSSSTVRSSPCLRPGADLVGHLGHGPMDRGHLLVGVDVPVTGHGPTVPFSRADVGRPLLADSLLGVARVLWGRSSRPRWEQRSSDDKVWMTPAAQAGSAAQWGPMPDASQLDAPTDLADLMNRLGGVASRSELTRWFEDAEIARAVAEGVVLRTNRGRYALPTAEAARMAAHRLTAVVGPRSAAASLGWALKTQPPKPEIIARSQGHEASPA